MCLCVCVRVCGLVSPAAETTVKEQLSTICDLKRDLDKLKQAQAEQKEQHAAEVRTQHAQHDRGASMHSTRSAGGLWYARSQRT